MNVPWLMRLTSGLLTTESRVVSPTNLCKIHEGQRISGTATAPSACVCPVSIIPPMVHIPPILNTTVFIRTREQSMGIFERNSTHSHVQKYWTQLYFHFAVVTNILVDI